MRYRSVLIVGVVLLAAGCSWPMAAQGPDRRAWGRNDTTVTAANAATLVKGWTGSVTSAAAEVVGDRDLLVVRDGTNVSGLDPKTGAVLWSRYLPGTGTPGVRGDGLYLPASDTLCSIVQADRKNVGDAGGGKVVLQQEVYAAAGRHQARPGLGD